MKPSEHAKKAREAILSGEETPEPSDIENYVQQAIDAALREFCREVEERAEREFQRDKEFGIAVAWNFAFDELRKE